MSSFMTETNTFSPLLTGMEGFKSATYFRNHGSMESPRVANLPQIEWRKAATKDGHDIVESICAGAQPAGIVTRSVYEELRDMIVDDVKATLPVDVILLNLHGAMVADGYHDCQGDVVERVRAVAGADAVIGVELDLHCHLTEKLCRNANLVITYKEYPHTDIADRARELYDLATRAKLGKVRPTMVYFDCRMIGAYRTTLEPFRSFLREVRNSEKRPGVLSISIAHGFPWGDVPEVGTRVLVISDNNRELATSLSREIGLQLWRLRKELLMHYDTIDEAIDVAVAAPVGPIVLADVADNAGGGAPSDNTAVLRRLVEKGVRGAATGCYWDPIATQLCFEGGLGATFDLRIGGKLGTASDQPIDLRVTVKGLSEDHEQTGLSGGRAAFGPSAWVHANGIDIILVTKRQQVFAPDAFTGLGCSLMDKKLVVVKSTEHFRAGFEPIAEQIRYMATRGSIEPLFDKIEYKNKATAYWPKVEDPFSNDGGE